VLHPVDCNHCSTGIPVKIPGNSHNTPDRLLVGSSFITNTRQETGPGVFIIEHNSDQAVPRAGRPWKEIGIMARNYKIHVHQRNGNFHVHPQGSLDDGSAWELITAIQSGYDGLGNVFVETKDLTEILPLAGQLVKTELSNDVVPSDKLFFKGKKGYDLAPNGSRVLEIIQKVSCGCRKKCASCHCRSEG
jgi:hypothetical protein